jgi:hypothetical protein
MGRKFLVLRILLGTVSLAAVTRCSVKGETLSEVSDGWDDIDGHVDIQWAWIEKLDNLYVRFCMELRDAVPAEPPTYTAYLWLLDTDGNPGTGQVSGDIGPDRNIRVAYDPGSPSEGWHGYVDFISEVAGTWPLPVDVRENKIFLTLPLTQAAYLPHCIDSDGVFDWRCAAFHDVSRTEAVGDDAPDTGHATADIAAVAGRTLLYEDFEDGAADELTEVGGTWQVVNGEYVQSMEDPPGPYRCWVHAGDFTGYTIEVDCTPLSGYETKVIYAHADRSEEYRFDLWLDRSRLCVPVWGQMGWTQAVEAGGLSLSYGETYHVTIEVSLTGVKVWLDGVLRHDQAWANGLPLGDGNVGVGTYAGTSRFDNLIVGEAPVIGCWTFDSLPFRVTDIVGLPGGGARLTWSGSPGCAFRVLSCHDLLTATWIEEATVLSRGTLTAWTDADTASDCKFYKIEDLSQGVALDQSGNDNHLTLSGASFSVPEEGISGRALRFVGDSDSAVASSVAGLRVRRCFTVELWIKPTADISGHYINRFVTFGDERYVFRIENGRLHGYLWEEGLEYPQSLHHVHGETEIATGVWSHVAFTYDGNEMKVWLNGELDGSVPCTCSIDQGGESDLVLSMGPAEPFVGLMDDLHIFDRALEQHQLGFYTEIREAEHFDYGGGSWPWIPGTTIRAVEATAAGDLEGTDFWHPNKSGPRDYRPLDDIGIETLFDVGPTDEYHTNIGWIEPGSWYRYTFHIPEPGRVKVLFRVASPTGGTLAAYWDEIVLGEATFATGHWHKFTDVSLEGRVWMAAGEHTLRVTLVSGQMNLDKIAIGHQPSTRGETQFDMTSVFNRDGIWSLYLGDQPGDGFDEWGNTLCECDPNTSPMQRILPSDGRIQEFQLGNYDSLNVLSISPGYGDVTFDLWATGQQGQFQRLYFLTASTNGYRGAEVDKLPVRLVYDDGSSEEFVLLTQDWYLGSGPWIPPAALTLGDWALVRFGDEPHLPFGLYVFEFDQVDSSKTLIEIVFMESHPLSTVGDPSPHNRFNVLAVTGCPPPATIYVDRSVPASGDGMSWQTALRTVQQGIDAACRGDTVIVAPGTYGENIHFQGKNIGLRSVYPKDPSVVAATIIDGGQAGSVVTFSGTEGQACVLSGFTIRNGRGDEAGGGIEGVGTYATIRNNIVVDNSAWSWEGRGDGGGLHLCHGNIRNNIISGNSACYGGGLSVCDGVIEGNHISHNTAASPSGIIVGSGGGLHGCDGLIQGNTISQNHAHVGGGLYWCAGTIQNNIISRNSADGEGGGLCGGRGPIQNNTIAGNSATRSGGGLHQCGGVQNCIVWANAAPEAPQVYAHPESPWAIPTYSCIQGWTAGGEGNIVLDPRFVDAGGNNYRLRSDSPCIDSAKNEDWMAGAFDLEGNPRIVNGTVDMGAYEFRP